MVSIERKTIIAKGFFSEKRSETPTPLTSSHPQEIDIMEFVHGLSMLVTKNSKTVS